MASEINRPAMNTESPQAERHSRGSIRLPAEARNRGKRRLPIAIGAFLFLALLISPAGLTATEKVQNAEVSVDQITVPNDQAVDLKVRITRGLNAKSLVTGDRVEGSLCDDLVVQGEKIAAQGDRIDGRITKIVRGKRTIKAYLPTKHWLNSQGRISISFFQIVRSDGKRLSIDAGPSPKTEVEQAEKKKLHMVVNGDGELTLKYAIKKYIATDMLVSGAVLATGPIGMVVAPAVTGTVGLISPSYANGRPVDADEPQSKMKNFLLGAGRGVPGGSVVFGLSTRGSDVGLAEGDVLTLRLRPESVVICAGGPHASGSGGPEPDSSSAASAHHSASAPAQPATSSPAQPSASK